MLRRIKQISALVGLVILANGCSTYEIRVLPTDQVEVDVAELSEPRSSVPKVIPVAEEVANQQATRLLAQAR